MREGIVFEELIEKIDLILNSSKPLPYHMKDERKLLLNFVFLMLYRLLLAAYSDITINHLFPFLYIYRDFKELMKNRGAFLMNDCVSICHHLFKRNEFSYTKPLESLGFTCVNAIYIFLN